MKRQKVDKINKKSKNTAEGIFDSIHASMHLIRSGQYRVLRDSPYQLTHMEGKMIGYFYRHPHSTLRELVQHSGRNKGQLARTIKVLKDQGLLQSQADPNDHRSHLLSLTTEGRKIHESFMGELQQLSKLAVKGLSPQECTQLYELLQRVLENLRAHEPG